MPGVPTLWVRDVARSSERSRSSAVGYDDDDAYVVPFTINDDGEPVPAIAAPGRRPSRPGSPPRMTSLAKIAACRI
jgi:hypothetical protein